MTASALTLFNKKALVVFYDFLALIAITVTPALSHMFSIPFYLIEPMRIFLILSIIHTNNKNAYLLAVGLPLFSYLISAHPVLPKMFLISSELSLNVFLFSLLSKRIENYFVPMFLSILLSKIYYYVIKLGLIAAGLSAIGGIDFPIYSQVIVVLGLSVYTYYILRKQN